MARGTQYSQQFKEDAVKYRKDYPELTLSQTATDALEPLKKQSVSWENDKSSLYCYI